MKSRTLLYMNMFFLFYLSYLMEMTFFCVLNMKYFEGNTLFEVLSLIGSILFVLFSIFIHIVLYRMILGIKSSKKKIHPIPIEEDKNIFSPERVEIKKPPKKFQGNFTNIYKSQLRGWWRQETITKSLSIKEPESKKEESITTENQEKENINENDTPAILILRKDFLPHSKTQYLYIMFLKMRYFVLSLILILLFPYPAILSSLYFLFNGPFLIYIALFQPFKSIFLFIINLILEISLMTAITGNLILSIKQSEGKYDFDEIMFNGWLIYYGNFIMIITIIFGNSWSLINSLGTNMGRFCFRKPRKVHNNP